MCYLVRTGRSPVQRSRDQSIEFFFSPFDRKSPARRPSDTLLNFLKFTITAIFCLTPNIDSLNLPDARNMTQCWHSLGRSVGPAIFGQAGKKKRPVRAYRASHTYCRVSCCMRSVTSSFSYFTTRYIDKETNASVRVCI